MSTPIRTVAVTATPSGRNQQAPSISCAAPGTFKTGQVLTCDPGSWSGPALTFTYQWKRGAADIAAANTATYTLVVADEGSNISCKVTATPADSNYHAGSAQTAQTITITA